MKILKLTIVGLIISQSVFAGYGKAIVGGAVGGAVAGVVTNAMSKNTNNTINSTHSELSKSSHGSLVVECYCMWGMNSDRASGTTVVRCYKDKGNYNGQIILYSRSNDITVIPLTTYDREYCEVSK